MKSKYIIPALISATLLSFFLSCRKGANPASEDEQLRIFSLVADPSYNGDYATALSRADSILSSVSIGDTLRGYIMIERDVALINSGQIDRALAYADTLIDFGKNATE